MAGRHGSGGIGTVRLAAVLASVLFHAALLAFLAHYAAQTTVYDAAPTLRVSLVPPPWPGMVNHDHTEPSPPPDHKTLARTEPVFPIQPLAPSLPGGDAAPVAPSGAAPREDDVAARTRQALRRLRGCDQARLTREEREQCETERWARAAPVTARLNLDLSGRYAKDPTPFLLRRPTNGCRARLAGDVDAMGDDSNARAGILCVVPF